uniref:Capsid protein n=1 Tax=uncultured marine virus TaxID=186617 RepID=S4TEG4_9VIRU|nr:hypothetical protein [uncultured marine virus]
MPGKKRSHSTKREKRSKKRGSVITGYNSAKSVLPGPLKNNVQVSMVYHDTFALDVGTGGIPAQYHFSANSLFDPNATGVGHQPRGYDELMSLYERYAVLKAKITLSFANSETNKAVIVGVTMDDNTSAVTTVNELMEQRYISYAIVGPKSAQNTGAVSIEIDPSKFLGISNKSEAMQGTAAANPNDRCYFRCFAQPAEATVDIFPVYCTVRIEYTARLSKPKTIGDS